VWRNLGFGMTLDEAVTGLGDLVQRHPTDAEVEAERQRNSSPIDVAVVREAGEECCRREGEAGRPVPDEITEAIKTIKAAMKSRTWPSNEWQARNGSARAGRLGGELRRIEPDGKIVVALANGQSAITAFHALDSRSRSLVATVRAAARAVEAYRQSVADREFKPDDSTRITSPHQLSVKEVAIEGLLFKPELCFTPNLSSIILRTNGAKAGTDAFEKLTESLRKDHGKEDEATKASDGRRRVWRTADATVILSQTVRQSDVPVYSQAAGPAYGNTAVSTVTRDILTIEFVCPDLKRAADRLVKGETISAGDGLRSKCGRYVLLFRKDGTLALHCHGELSPAWTSHPGGFPAVAMKLCEDGSLALFDGQGKVVWETATGGRGGEFICMQDDGNLVIYTSKLQPIWATNTARR
jgi:hypothetical protein